MNSSFNITTNNNVSVFTNSINDQENHFLHSNNNTNNENNVSNFNEKIEELIFSEYEEKKENLSRLKISSFKNTNINLEKLNYCIQNVNWHEINKNREDLIRHYETHQEANRNNYEISAEEQAMKRKFNLDKQTDIYFTFSEYHLHVEPIYNHFQLRKNLISISDKEFVFFNSKGVEMLNIISSKKTQLVFLKQDEYDKIICFDAFKVERKISAIESNRQNKKEFEVHFVFGKFNNRIVIKKLRVFEKMKKLVSEDIFSKEILVSDLAEQNQLINFVKFSEDRKYIYTSCNDCYIRIYDYENEINLVAQYKSKNCVNHFSYNENQNILAAVGDFEEVHLIDPKSSKTISYLKGHYDFGFVANFKPGSDYILATGNQDCSAKIWDLRKIADEMEDKKIFMKNYFWTNRLTRKETKMNFASLISKKNKYFWDFNYDEYLSFLNETINLIDSDKKIFCDIENINCKQEKIIQESNNKEINDKLNDIEKVSNKACIKTYFGVSNSIGDLKFAEDDFLLMLENTYNLHIVNLKDDKIQSIKYIGNGIGIDYNKKSNKIYLALFQYDYSGIYSYKRISNYMESMELRNSENNFTEMYSNI